MDPSTFEGSVIFRTCSIITRLLVGIVVRVTSDISIAFGIIIICVWLGAVVNVGIVGVGIFIESVIVAAVGVAMSVIVINKVAIVVTVIGGKTAGVGDIIIIVA